MTISIRNRLNEIGHAHRSFLTFIGNYQVEDALIQKMSIVIDEVLSNIIQYGFKSQEIHTIDIEYIIHKNILEMKFVDDGRPFNPLMIPQPDLNHPLELIEGGGLGIHIMRNLADDINYSRIDGRNYLVIKKSVL